MSAAGVADVRSGQDVGLVRGICLAGCWSGAYLLLIRFRRPAALRAGRLNHGEAIAFPAGDYVYVGSAMGQNDGLYLPKRLVRHATRTGKLPAHAIREDLLAHFVDTGLSRSRLTPAKPKRLFWNVDHALDHAHSELRNVYYLRSAARLEAGLALWLEDRPDTEPAFPGFGAHDHPGHTHLLRLSRASGGWRALCAELESEFASAENGRSAR